MKKAQFKRHYKLLSGQRLQNGIDSDIRMVQVTINQLVFRGFSLTNFLANEATKNCQ